MIIEPRFSPDWRRQINDLPPVEVLAKDRIAQHRRPLILANTDLDPEFKQILKTARIGSALYAPATWHGEILGQLVLASQARNTYAQIDLDILCVFAEAATALWIAHGGPAFLRSLA